MAKNSKQKGNKFERTVCKFWEKWTGYEFQRVPQSGGLRWKNASDITSDVICTDKKHSKRFPFSVECKSYQDIRFEHILLEHKSCKIIEFWEQTKRDAKRGGKIPTLFMRYNSMPKDEMFVIFNISSLVGHTLNFKKPTMTIALKTGEVIYVCMASDILANLTYLDVYKQNRQLLKTDS